MKPKKLIVQELFNIVWDEHWDCDRFQNSGHAAEVKRNYDKHIKAIFAEKKITSIKRKKVREWHQSLRDFPVAANRSLEVLSRMFTFAVEKDWIDAADNPCIFIKSHRERKRKRYATEDEITKLGEFLDRNYHVSPRGVTFLYALLYTGARPRSLERAKWQDITRIENGFGLFTFEGKSSAETGEDETVLIAPKVMELIEALPKRVDGLVFGIKKPRELWDRIRKEAGCPDLWARDLRRTFASVGRSNGVDMDTIGQLLNHKSTQTTMIYAKLYPSARVHSVSLIADKLNTLLNPQKLKVAK